eukprot:scaffold978_cov164-Amphora_coffeaeformis.AAC.13
MIDSLNDAVMSSLAGGWRKNGPMLHQELLACLLACLDTWTILPGGRCHSLGLIKKRQTTKCLVCWVTCFPEKPTDESVAFGHAMLVTYQSRSGSNNPRGSRYAIV